MGEVSMQRAPTLRFARYFTRLKDEVVLEIVEMANNGKGARRKRTTITQAVTVQST